MTQPGKSQSDRIRAYLADNPAARTSEVAAALDVKKAMVSYVRSREDLYGLRKLEAKRRRMLPPELDKMILEKVYQENLVSIILDKEKPGT